MSVPAAACSSAAGFETASEHYAGQRRKGLCTPRVAVPARWAAHRVRGSCPTLAACAPAGECPGQEPSSPSFVCMPCSEVGSLGL